MNKDFLFGFNGILTLNLLLLGCMQASTQFERPYGIHVEKDGTIFVSDFDRGVVELNQHLEEQMILTGMESPHAVTRIHDGSLLVADYRGANVHHFSAAGEKIGLFHEGTFEGPAHIYTDRSGNIWVADYTANRVHKFLYDGQPTNWKADGEEEFNQPHGVSVDQYGNVYIVEVRNFRVQKFDPTGKFIAWIGHGADGWTTEGKAIESSDRGGFNLPTSLQIVNDMYLIVSEVANNRVQLFDLESGKILQVIEHNFDRPYAAEMYDGKLFVADTYNKKIHIMKVSLPIAQ